MADISLKNFVSWILWIFFAWTRCVAKVCRSHISISATTYTTSITFECLKIGTQSWQARFTFVCIDIDHIQLLRTAFFWPVTQRVVEPPFPNWYSKLTGTFHFRLYWYRSYTTFENCVLLTCYPASSGTTIP